MAAAIHVTVKNDDFAFGAGGRLMTEFDLYGYSFRRGAEPDRLHAQVRALGLDIDGDRPEYPDDPVSCALALAERATGVHLSATMYAEPALIGPTEDLYPYA